MRTFAVHDPPNSGVEVDTPPYTIRVSSLEYADDAALLDESVEKASDRLSASGSRTDAAMDISIPKTKAMHIHKQVRVPKSETHEIEALKLKHICPD